jgi:hypothetical protein
VDFCQPHDFVSLANKFYQDAKQLAQIAHPIEPHFLAPIKNSSDSRPMDEQSGFNILILLADELRFPGSSFGASELPFSPGILQ